MSLFVKLCGIRTAADLEAAADAGADAVGFVLTSSPRQVSVAEAAMLMEMVPDGMLGVAVFHDPSADLIRQTAEMVAPDLFQAEAGRLTALAPDRTLPVVVADGGLEGGLERALAVTNRDMVLVDSAAQGGTGRVADWDLLGSLQAHDRLILAGGLDPGNVAEAVARVRPLGVDVSSGVEVRPGEKDHELMRAFVEVARRELDKTERVAR
ncbi:MAG: phosphoribosylanthranilate isomerase [Acidimicrobiia bacterium]